MKDKVRMKRRVGKKKDLFTNVIVTLIGKTIEPAATGHRLITHLHTRLMNLFFRIFQPTPPFPTTSYRTTLAPCFSIKYVHICMYVQAHKQITVRKLLRGARATSHSGLDSSKELSFFFLVPCSCSGIPLPNTLVKRILYRVSSAAFIPMFVISRC